jgi:hypothetical protein
VRLLLSCGDVRQGSVAPELQDKHGAYSHREMPLLNRWRNSYDKTVDIAPSGRNSCLLERCPVTDFRGAIDRASAVSS